MKISGRITPPKKKTLERSVTLAAFGVLFFLGWLISFFVWPPSWGDILAAVAILLFGRAYELLLDGVTTVGK